MPKKRPNPIEHPDTSKEDKNYWEEVLRSHGLTMKRGFRPNVASYIGGNKELVDIEGKQVEETLRGGKRVKPIGHGPEE